MQLENNTDKDAPIRYCYRIISHLHSNPDLGEYYSFGLMAEERTAAYWKQLETIYDISTDLSFVTDLSERFNLHQLHPVHFRDAVEDHMP